MKKLLLLNLFFICYFIVPAQFTQLAESAVLPAEPEDGFAKIMQLQNGNTFYVHTTIKRGMNIKVFDAGHKQQVDKHFDLSYKNLNKAGAEAIFESCGDVIILMSEFQDDFQILYRVIIDGQGNLKEDKRIAEVPLAKKKNKLSDGGASWRKDYIDVRKDPNSDHYAVVLFNKTSTGKINYLEAFEVIWYNAKHKEIKRSMFSSPRADDVCIQFLDMVVMGDSKIYVLASGFTAENAEEGKGELYLMTLEPNATNPAKQMLSLLPNTRSRQALLRYNLFAKKLMMLAAGKIQGKYNGEHDFVLAYIDPATQKIERSVDPFPVHANEKCMALFGKKHPFTGLPQQIFFNANGSFTIIYEEMTSLCDQYDCSTELGHIAVLTFDKDGRAGNSYFIAKQFLNIGDLELYYPAHREGNAQSLQNGDQFKSYAYLNGKEKCFLLLNDIEQNEAAVQKGKITRIMGVTECNGFYYPLNGMDIMPSRHFVFAKPVGKDKNNLGLFTIASYDAEKNIYVTLKLERDDRKKTAKLVWLQPN